MIKVTSSFSKRLKELRESKKLSQAQLSINLNYKISSSAIGLWELGKREPALSAVILLANYFNVSLGYMAGIEEFE